MEPIMKIMFLSFIYSGIAIADHWALIVEEGRRLKAWAMFSQTQSASDPYALGG